MLKLYNTLTRKKEIFRPWRPPQVGMYSCGPTVYNFAHIGNLRTYIFADILRRTLVYNGYQVKQVMNITDVGHLVGDRDLGEDKMEAGAKREKKSAWEIARFYTQAFKRDLKALNILSPHHWPRATAHIKEQIALVKKLEKKGYTYQISDGIYFDTARLRDYGKLAHLDIKGLKEGARVEPNLEKKNPTDFALWKFSPQHKKREMEWRSPWGKGFPGWHIECSAMSTKYLGQPFDIHTGGVDHIPLHHTNEIAQSEAALAKPLAHFWLHDEFLVMAGAGKMAKTGEKFITLGKIMEKGYNPLAFRYFVMGAHYRHKLNFSWPALEAAKAGLNNLYKILATDERPKIGCAEYEEKFREAINNDLDIPKALAITWQLIHNQKLPTGAKKKTLLKFDKILGLNFAKIKKKKIKVPDEIQKLIKAREEARKNKNWLEADRIRDLIRKKGFSLEDTPKGPELKEEPK